jgi:hypothetical protein
LSIDNSIVLFFWELGFHGSIAKLRERQLSAKAFVVKRHGFRTISVKQKKWRATQHIIHLIPLAILVLALAFRI